MEELAVAELWERLEEAAGEGKGTGVAKRHPPSYGSYELISLMCGK